MPDSITIRPLELDVSFEVENTASLELDALTVHPAYHHAAAARGLEGARSGPP